MYNGMDRCRLMFINWSWILVAFTFIQSSLSASVYTNTNLGRSHVESLCSHIIEKQMQNEGKESSLMLDLNPGLTIPGPCKKTLLAPESHGFFVRLAHIKGIKPKISMKNHHSMGSKATNTSTSCPLSIYSTDDLLAPPWRIDPCRIEILNDLDEPGRFLTGHLRIIWEHNGNIPAFRLIITVLGKGVLCQQKNKFPCLQIGLETLLCISNDLVCDGIQHCPKGEMYNNDEDLDMCFRRRNNGSDHDIIEKLSIKWFQNFLNDGVTPSTKINNITPTNKVSNDKKSQNGNSETQGVRNITRSGLAGDLSRYGPWGYLMLGMLLCGGALLICGLWECCCRQNKNETNISASTRPANSTENESGSANTTIQDTTPPNYEELDPPPAYSALFPNQKAEASVRSNSDSNNLEPSQTSTN